MGEMRGINVQDIGKEKTLKTFESSLLVEKKPIAYFVFMFCFLILFYI